MKCLLLFTALVATANALTCQSSNTEKDTCTTGTGKCYSIEKQFATVKDKPLNITIKGCVDDKADPNFCTQGFILMSVDKDIYLMSNVTCCDKDLCNKDISPTLNKTFPKGNLVCPSCFHFKKEMCDGKSINCNIHQKKCFNMTGTVKTGSAAVQHFTARGCAVENNVYTKGVNASFGDTTYEIESVQLGDAKSEKPKGGASQLSSCLSFALLLPSVLWFLLDSSLY